MALAIAGGNANDAPLDRPRPSDIPQVPVAFVENRGQWPTRAAFVARLQTMILGVEPGALALTLPTTEPRGSLAVRMEFEGSAPDARLQPIARTPGRHNFLYGPDPARWVTGARGYATVVSHGVYSGVDIRVRLDGGADGDTPEYDLLLAPGADLSHVRCRVRGVDGMTVDADGTLVLQTPHGTLRQPPPHTWMTLADGRHHLVDCTYRVLDSNTFGFSCPERDATVPLVVDPSLLWSTHFGGTAQDDGLAVGVGPSGDVTLGGTTLSPDLPTTFGAHDITYNGESFLPQAIGDAFARFDGDTGQLQWATYLGGRENDYLCELQVTPSGEAVVSGWTGSPDFPITAGAYDVSFNGLGPGLFLGGDLFISRLTADGTGLVYSTFIGGSDLEYVNSMCVDPTGAVTVSGHVHSDDFPTTAGAHSRTLNQFSDIFVTRLNATGTALLFSTYFGGSTGEEYGRGLAVDPATGTTFVGGPTDADNLPVTTGAYDTTYNGGQAHFADGFVAAFDPAGALVFCTYLGSPGDDAIHGLSVDAGGITVIGETNSALFPTTSGAFDTTHNGDNDVFVSRLDLQGSTLLASTFVGAGGRDRGSDVEPDGAGGVVIVGDTTSPDFPLTTGTFSTTYGNFTDGFVARLDASLGRLLYATYMGGNGFDLALDAELDHTGAVAVAGTTFATTFPTTAGAWDPTYNGSGDAWAAKLSLLPTGAERYGEATAGCAGHPYIGVTTMARAGATDFALTCARAQPNSPGIALLGGSALPAPVPLLGVGIWVDATIGVAIPIVTSSLGGTERTVPIPSNPSLIGGTAYAQFIIADLCGSAGLAATGALAVTIQP